MQKLVLKKDITEKPGYQPYFSDGEWKKDLVAIRIPRFDNDGEPAVVLAGVRGTQYRIPRDRNVKVPRAIVEAVKGTIQHQWAIGQAGVEMAGLRYVGKKARFHVLELSGKEADAAPVLGPAKPIGANERASLDKQAAVAAREEAEAKAEIRSAPVHPDLLRAGLDTE